MLHTIRRQRRRASLVAVFFWGTLVGLIAGAAVVFALALTAVLR